MITLLQKVISKLIPPKGKFPIPDEQMMLYPDEIPNSRPAPDKESSTVKNGVLRIYHVSRPTLSIFRPEKPNGMAVIICPGGAYTLLSFSKEGLLPAAELARWGITTFVLKYRLPDDATCVDKSIAPVQDLQQALKIVYARADEWGIDRDKIGVMGFSAGAHVTSTLVTHDEFQSDPLKKSSLNLKPAFNILIYPVMNMDSHLAHPKSRDTLLGPGASPEKLRLFSNEQFITANTPATFIVHAKDDTSVPFENSIRFYEGCVKNGVPAEIHLLEQGGHGFGTTNKSLNPNWMELLSAWLKRL